MNDKLRTFNHSDIEVLNLLNKLRAIDIGGITNSNTNTNSNQPSPMLKPQTHQRDILPLQNQIELLEGKNRDLERDVE